MSRSFSEATPQNQGALDIILSWNKLIAVDQLDWWTPWNVLDVSVGPQSFDQKPCMTTQTASAVFVFIHRNMLLAGT